MAYMKDSSGRRLDSFAVAPNVSSRSALPTFNVRKIGVSYTVAGGSTAAPYWPQIINVQGKVPSPLGKYYRLRSTDHSTGDGGLWVDYADSPTATAWTSTTNGTTPAYVDLTLGHQSETFRAVYAPAIDATNPWFVYYQQAGAGTGQQQTVLCKTANFITFTRVGVVLDVPSLTTQPGDGHMGYFSPHLIGNRIIGPSLRGGTTIFHHVMNESYDGVNFYTDPRLLGGRPDWLALTGNRDFNQSNLHYVNWRGQTIALGALRSTSGAATSVLAWAPVSSDYRQFLAPPSVIFTATETYETPEIVSFGAFVEDGRIIVVAHYDAGNTSGPGTGASGTTQAILATYELTGA